MTKEFRQMIGQVTGVRRFALVAFVAVLPVLSGCDGFFVPPATGGGGGTGNTGNRTYVANSSTNTMSGFTVGTGSLTNVPGSPVALGYPPAAAVVTPNNALLYVAGPGAIYVYAIGADGSLSGSSQGAAVAIVNVVSLDVSPDGNWLFGLDGTTTVIQQFKINQSNGSLTSSPATPYSVASAQVVPKMIRVAPSGTLIFASLGTAGEVVFTFNTTTGAVVSSQQLATGSAQTSDNALTIDSNTALLYIARTGLNGGIAVYTIGAGGVLNQISGSPFASGSQTSSLVLDSTSKFLYAANRGDGTISGYTVGTGGVLAAIAGSPYASGTGVTALGIDKTGKYLLAAANGGSPDVSMYGFDAATPGKLILATTAASGASPAGAVALALTH